MGISLWVALAPCGEGREGGGEGCLQESCFFFFFFLLRVTEGSDLTLSGEEGWS